MNILKKFNSGLEKTSDFFGKNIKKILSSNKINQETLDEIESSLIASDIGIDVSNQLSKKSFVETFLSSVKEKMYGSRK